MAARQLWVFLSPKDVPFLLEKIRAREPGLVWSEGRYLRGDVRLLLDPKLLETPSLLERRQSLPDERRIYLFHPKHSTELVAHEQPAGPFMGWSQIDEERSDCLMLRVPLSRPGTIEPSHLYAHTSFWRAGEKIRKKPAFALWANQTLRWLIGELPSTSAKFMRAAPDALARAIANEAALTYLLRTIAPLPASLASPTGALPASPDPSLSPPSSPAASSSSPRPSGPHELSFSPQPVPAGAVTEESFDEDDG